MNGTSSEAGKGRGTMTEEQRVEELIKLILWEKRGWAERLPLIREELARLEITNFELTAWLRQHGVRTGRGPISESSVARILRGDYPPDSDVQDAILEMLREASLGNWSKARYLSFPQLADAFRPLFHLPPVLRRLTLVGVTLTLALGLMTNTASAGTTDYGPGGTADASTTPTTYTMPIPVIDSLAPTLNPERRKIWKQARNAALAAWTTGCVSFTVTIDTTAGTWDDSIGDLGYSRLLTSGAITIFRNESSSPQMLGYWDSSSGGGFAVYAPWAPWWKDYYRTQMVGDIGHELGHALGFGHGGDGIMMGATDRPTATDLALLRSYYC
jgi:hypothetical protein